MDRGVNNPPRFPQANPIKIQLMYLSKDRMRQFLVHHFGGDFLNAVINSQEPLFLPVVIYGATWDICIYILL